MLSTDESFELFWTLYPERNGRKLEKKLCKAAFSKLAAQGHVDNLLIAVNNYRESSIVQEGYAKDAFRWLRSWDEWLEAPKKKVSWIDIAREEANGEK